MIIRTRCEVPFCKRTHVINRNDGFLIDVGEARRRYAADEWICQKHWRNVPESLRKLYREAKRRCRETKSMRSMLVANRVWERCKAAALKKGL